MWFRRGFHSSRKLQEILPTRPITYKGQNVISFLVLGGAVEARRVQVPFRIIERASS